MNHDGSLAGKAAFVTGAASGIGRARRWLSGARVPAWSSPTSPWLGEASAFETVGNASDHHTILEQEMSLDDQSCLTVEHLVPTPPYNELG